MPNLDDPRSRGSLAAEIVASFLPRRPALPAAERAAVEDEVTRAVVAQLGAMPPGLRLAVRAALAAFDVLPVLRWGRTFRRLDTDRRQAWIRTWDEGGVGPMPALVKLLRACSLFAWFDHPRVTAALAAGAGD
jgi:hypothetical protein